MKLKKQSKDLIRSRALEYVEQYKNEMTDDLYAETKKQVEEAKIGKKKTKSGSNTSTKESNNIAKKKAKTVEQTTKTKKAIKNN